jgi:hypothetical protein
MLTRKQFLRSALDISAVALGLSVLNACGNSSSGGGADAASAANCLANGTNVTIGANHGHVMMVSIADITAAADMTYHIMGTATHDHNVELTPANYATLAANNVVMVTSSTTENHSHPIMVACA